MSNMNEQFFQTFKEKTSVLRISQHEVLIQTMISIHCYPIKNSALKTVYFSKIFKAQNLLAVLKHFSS